MKTTNYSYLCCKWSTDLLNDKRCRGAVYLNDRRVHFQERSNLCTLMLGILDVRYFRVKLWAYDAIWVRCNYFLTFDGEKPRARGALRQGQWWHVIFEKSILLSFNHIWLQILGRWINHGQIKKRKKMLLLFIKNW